MLLIKQFINSCQKYADKTVLIDGDNGTSLTYRDLFAKVESLSKYFASNQTSANIGILLPNSPEFVITFFAVLLSGKTAIPLNYLLEKSELEYIIKQAEITTVITSDYYKEIKDFNDTAVELHAIDSTRLSTILYTSGTSGHPKGVMLSDDNLLSNVTDMKKSMRMECYTILSILPFFHGFGLTCGLLKPIISGGTVVLAKRFNPKQVSELIEKYNINMLLSVPSVYGAFLRSPESNKSLGNLDLCVSGGEALAKDIQNGFNKHFNQSIYEGYGLTETSPVISLNMPHAHKIGSVGKPLASVDVKFADDDEIWVKGPNVMKGYYKQPELTDEVITKDGWFKTGDIGKLDNDGFLFITGRKKDMIISSGENIFPAEIEHVLSEHPEIVECAVIGVTDKRRGEVPKAFIVCNKDKEVKDHDIKDFCRGKLANFKIPAHIEIRPELPKGPTGKILKKVLKEI